MDGLDNTSSKLAEMPAFAALNQSPFGSVYTSGGMTYRQWLAGMALCAFAGTNEPNVVAQACIAYADAVIAELEKH